MGEQRLELGAEVVPAWVERIALVGVALASFAPFVWCARRAVALAVTVPPGPIDRAVPLAGAWEFVYAAVFFVVFVPVALVRERRLLRTIAAGIIAMQFVACAVFFLWPTRIERPIAAVAPLRSFLDWALGLNFAIDPPVNCFPSLHVGNAVYVALIARRLDRRVGLACGVLAALIAASTLFVKAHLAIDVAAGALLGWTCYRTLVAARLPDLPGEDLLFPRRWMLVVLGAYVAFVACVVSAWAAGARYPWPPAW